VPADGLILERVVGQWGEISRRRGHASDSLSRARMLSFSLSRGEPVGSCCVYCLIKVEQLDAGDGGLVRIATVASVMASEMASFSRVEVNVSFSLFYFFITYSIIVAFLGLDTVLLFGRFVFDDNNSYMTLGLRLSLDG